MQIVGKSALSIEMAGLKKTLHYFQMLSVHFPPQLLHFAQKISFESLNEITPDSSPAQEQAQHSKPTQLLIFLPRWQWNAHLAFCWSEKKTQTHSKLPSCLTQQWSHPVCSDTKSIQLLLFSPAGCHEPILAMAGKYSNTWYHALNKPNNPTSSPKITHIRDHTCFTAFRKAVQSLALLSTTGNHKKPVAHKANFPLFWYPFPDSFHPHHSWHPAFSTHRHIFPSLMFNRASPPKKTQLLWWTPIPLCPCSAEYFSTDTKRSSSRRDNTSPQGPHSVILARYGSSCKNQPGDSA